MKALLPLLLCSMMSMHTFAQQSAPATNFQNDKLLSQRTKAFQKNLGQIDAPKFPHKILYFLKTPGLDLYLTDKGLTYFFYKALPNQEVEDNLGAIKALALSWERMELLLDNASIKSENIIELNKSRSSSNYFSPNFPDGLYGVPEFRDLLVKQVYPGIDWHLYFNEAGQLKYDFIVAAGADPALIHLNYLSPNGSVVNKSGDLEVRAKDYQLTEAAPYSYVQGSKQTVESRFEIEPQEDMGACQKNSITFKLGDYSKNQTLIIDPTLYWSTAFGGSFNDRSKGIVTDANGNIYVTGLTQSTDFIVQNAGTYFQGTGNSNGKAFIMKFNSALALVWSTFYGGSSGNETAMCIAIDKSQQIYISGYTYTNNFPLQSNGGFMQNTYGGSCDAFILKFDTTGTRKWATYYGGNDLEFGLSIACDQTGAVYVAGLTYSSNFPLQNQGAFFMGNAPNQGNTKGFIVKFDNSSARQWSTYYDCNRINAITTDATNHILVTGFTYGTTHTVNPGGGAYFLNAPSNQAFVGRFTQGGVLVWATYYGGNSDDYGHSIITDRHSNVFIAGITRSTDLALVGDENAYQYAAPTSTLPSNTVADAYLAKFDSSGVRTWATYYGSTGFDEMSTHQNLAVDACDRLYFALESSPGNTLSISTQTACEGGYIKTIGTNFDQHVVRFSNNGARQWASIFGGDGPDVGSAIYLNPDGDLYMTGNWDPSIPSTYTFVNPGAGASFSTNPAGTSQSFVAKFIGAVINTPPQYIYPTICSNITTSMMPQFTGSFVQGGTFKSSSPSLNVNPVTGLLTLASTPPGNYTISYNSYNCTCNTSRLQVAIQDCSGINEATGERSQFEIFPNPSNGLFTVRANSVQHLSVVNSLGQVVKTISPAANTELAVDLSDLPNGIYCVQAEHQNSTSQKLIILH